MKILAPAALALLMLTACDSLRQAAAPVAPPPPAPAARPIPGGQGVAAESFDRTTEAERRKAMAPQAAGAALGTVTVALGAPAESGFWLRSSLVTAEQPGRVELPGGRSLAVTLRPGEGAAQLSLAAYRALGLGLTDLPQMTVYGS
ncbi:hypothetical protein [Cereibacter sphaeroides]|uniref:hypothetical protein n=1 Tax=Cereibacter sphaeroides TaxID=1063 RepID=UPI000191C505|nr:hypothetical protein [Cereibacter sphaeroides]ACM01416.1 Hypothetical Protein RSKD131_1556 [Cereibacter sphaeroides KD131]RHZ95354.1 hypothetical protein D1122_14990 [Cereibacter sphaeroides]